ncbi:MAG: J domain-containing protein [Nitrospinae bacterium]|nr:J domain-containing protein [Nitrospinota bacterium]
MSALTQIAAPDLDELKRKKAVLAGLEQELAERELELSTLRGELRLFENLYNARVGAKYAELDEAKARVMEMAARFFPQSGEFQSGARSAREQADQSARENRDAGTEPPREKTFSPSEDLRKLFREVAKKIHPDLSSDPKERERRHDLMARLNMAYEGLDEHRIRAILQEWEDGRKTDDAAGLGLQLVKAIRKIAQARLRLESIRDETERLRNCEMFKLMEKIGAAEKEGRDILGEMVSEIEDKIDLLRSKVKKLAGEALGF